MKTFAARLTAKEASPPVDFRLGDETAATVLARADRADDTWTDPVTGLAVTLEVRTFPDADAVDWVVRFTNTGDTRLPVLTDVASLALDWPCGEAAFLYRAPGSDETPRDFQYQCVPLQTIRQRRGSVALHAGTQGRSSVDWLPFFNLHSDSGEGLIVAIGWTGQWWATVDRDGDAARIRAGMDGLRLALDPGESIRGPRVLLLPWHGTPADGQNALRRLLRDHYLPRVDGTPVVAPLCYGAWGGTPTPGHLQQLDRIHDHQLPYDCYWIDAGWYGTSEKPCPSVFEGEWWITGDWRVNRRYHPDTLKPIADKIHAQGLDFLLWVEPERAKHGTPTTLEHPEWFLDDHPEQPRQKGDNLLLNLGLPEAREWVTDLISGLIKENALDWYRQDFNMPPLPCWRAADPPDRQGITEIRYVEGLYAFLDDLRRRHPRLKIDNCASGGRRLDLEMAARCIPLWRNDYNCFPSTDPEVFQVHGLGLSQWLPQHATSPCNFVPGDTYRVRSVIAPGLVFSVEEFGAGTLDLDAYPWDWHRQMLTDYRRARPFWDGDFYALTTDSTAPDAWIGLQLHRPDLDAGMVLVFRRAASPVVSAEFPLHGLRPGTTYTWEDADTADTWQLADAILALTIPEPRTARLLFYRAAPAICGLTSA